MSDEKRKMITRQRHNKGWKKWIVGIVVVSLLLLLGGMGIWLKGDGKIWDKAHKITGIVKQKQEFHALDDVEDADAVLQAYNSYGTSLNLNGTIQTKPEQKVKKLVFIIRDVYAKSSEKPVFKKKLKMEQKENEVAFSFSEEITDGLCLEKIKSGTYCALLAVINEDGTKKYHSFTDESVEKKLTYYTLTRNNSNQKIKFSTKRDKKTGLTYWSISSKKAKLPENVYDVVIDAGHGGTDSGAVNGEYTEAELTLEYALALQKKLEQKGYKVCMTRNGSEDSTEKTAYTMYDHNGRVNVTAGSGAKYCMCLHLNSNEASVNISGVQVYCTARGNIKMAKSFADNIVEYTGTSYSGMQTYKITDGVYQRAYTENEIAQSAQKAQNAGYEPYTITTDTDYYYMVRETGGVATNAYIDGRNTTYGKNEFLKSNQGVQTCLIEMGYISEDTDLLNLLNNKEQYVAAMADTIIQTAEKAGETNKNRQN